MTKLAFIFAPAIICIALSGQRPAHAEGCEKGFRDWKPSEKAFFAKARSLMAALPPPPAGWRVKEDEDGKDEDSGQFCLDREAGLVSGSQPLQLRVSRTYERADIADRQQKLESAAETMPQEPSAADQKLIDAYTLKAEAAMKKMTAAAEKGETAATQTYSEEYQKWAGKAMEIQSKGVVELGAKQKALFKNTSAKVEIEFNRPEWDSNYEHPQRLAVAGAAGAWREMLSAEDQEADHADSLTTVVFGSWHEEPGSKDDPYLRLRAPRSPAPGGTKLRTIWVRITADHGTADALLKGLGAEKLKTSATAGGL